MTTLNIQIDDTVKSEAQRVLDEIGLSMSGAINVYLVQIARSRAIPFHLSADPEVFEPTPALEALVDKTKKDIQRNRNLSPPLGKRELKARHAGFPV
jgi:DNA-damage-inducible protein J